MAKLRFTDLSLRSLPEGTYYDSRTPCFGFRKGKRRSTFFVTKDQTRTKITIAHFPDTSLADARKKALVALGSPLAKRETPTYPEARAEYLAQGKWRDNSREQVTLQLTRFHCEKSLDQITHQDIAHAIAQIKYPSAAWHFHKDLRSFFNWCVPRYLQLSPVNGIKPPSRYIPRERVLSDDEIVRIWHAADPNEVYGATIRLLILCGQRLTETSLMCPDWINSSTITIPAQYTKNGRAHTFPIPQSAIPLIQVLRPFGNWQHRKPALDTASGTKDWTHHDLRRTYATNLQRLGIRLEVTENLLNHSSGSRSGIVGIYHRYSWRQEMHEAVAKYENWLINLLAR
jgi:integrase